MAEFHFLRPWWFVALPVGAWLLWQLLRGRGESGGWRNVVDAKLRRYVLIEPEVLRDNRLALIVALAAWLIAIVAIAGPAWERLPVPAFRSDEALVVALDLSRSMDAGDVEPSRLARARLKLLDLLERRASGQTALVVFTTHAFTVTPLTTDIRTISSLVGCDFDRDHADARRLDRRRSRQSARVAAPDRRARRRRAADHGLGGR